MHLLRYFRFPMRLLILISIFLLRQVSVSAQTTFEVLVSRGPFVAGQSFRVQYVMEQVAMDDEFFPPDFGKLELITGPQINPATQNGTSGLKKLQNISYTLKANRAGRYILPGARARINGKMLSCNSVTIDVLSEAEAQRQLQGASGLFSEFYLAPGEDPQKKIEGGIFMKVQVDRQHCFVGQPVEATFKLYSRLQSSSDIVKNPGFYGFAVQDIIGLKDQVVTKERVNGREYDVNVVRKVQLYPLQEGNYTIDPMEVINKISFWKGGAHQEKVPEVVEGVFGEEERKPDANVVTVENTMRTQPVHITVRPLPEQGQPVQYAGAVGRFTIASKVSQNRLAKNEPGILELVISGKGNLTQLTAPRLEWPSGIEAFEPVAADSLQLSASPMQGTRTFRYRFVSSTPGSYALPVFAFSFFDPDSNRYKTLSSAAGNVEVTREEKAIPSAGDQTVKRIEKPVNPATLYLSAIVLLVIAGVIYTWRSETRKAKKAAIPPPPPPRVYLSVADALQPAVILQEAAERDFLQALRQSVLQFFQDRVPMTGSGLSKQELLRLMQSKGVAETVQQQLLRVLEICEAGLYAPVDSGLDKNVLLSQTRQLLQQIEQRF